MTKQILENIYFYDKLTNDEKNLVDNSFIVKEYKKGEILHEHTDTCLGFVHVINGVLRSYLMSDDGREVTLYTVDSGESDILSASCVINQISFDSFLIADTDCEVLIIPVTIMAKIKEKNIYAYAAVMELTADRFSDAMWAMQQIMFMKLDERIASFLIDLSVKNNSNRLDITHEEIAKNISATREASSRMLKRMQSDGLIEYQRGKIEIIDMKRLKGLLSL